MLQDKVFRGNAKPVLLIGFTLSCVFILCNPVSGRIHKYAGSCGLPNTGWSRVNAFLYPAIVVFVSGTYPVQIVGKMLGLWMGLGAFGGAAGLFVGGLAVAKFGNYNLALPRSLWLPWLGLSLRCFL